MRQPSPVILFFFLLLMLALAWGVADHYRDLLAQQPPPPAPVKVEKPLAVAPPAVIPPTATDSGQQAPEKAATDGDGAASVTEQREERSQ